MLSYLLCLELGRLAPTTAARGLRDRTPAPPPPLYAVAPSVLLLHSFGVRVRVVGRPNVPVIVPRRVDKADTHIVELDHVGDEQAGLPVRLAKVMVHDCPF